MKRGQTMKLHEFLTLDFINSIPYISANETENSENIYNWILVKGYNKIVSNYIDMINDEIISKQAFANIISAMFSDKWTNLKKIIAENITATGTTDTTTETIKNNIYGYNGTATDDYERTRTLTENKEYSDLFEKLKQNIDFREMFSYYNTVVTDILKMLTIEIY